MKYDLPPFNEKEKRGFFEQRILEFSSMIFKNPIFGISLGIILNLIFLFSYFQSKNCLSTILNIFLVYLMFSIILFQLSNMQKNK